MDGYELYVKYVAHKCHFNQKKYDVRKFPRTRNTTPAAYDRRNDKSVFQYAAKGIREEDADDFLKANFIHNPSFWIGDECSHSVWVDWQKRNANIAYTIKTDLGNVAHWRMMQSTSWQDVFQGKPFMKFGLSHMIAVETFVIFDNAFFLFDYYTKHFNNFLWESRVPVLKKYGLFFEGQYDREYLKSLIRQA